MSDTEPHAQEEILAKLAHKLRTPITEIRWNAAGMLDDKVNPLSDVQRQSLQMLLKSADHLVEIVDTIAPLKK